MTDFHNWLINQYACSQAINWVGYKTVEEAWETCPYASWMIWLAVEADAPRKDLIHTTCACVREVLSILPTERRAYKAIEAAESELSLLTVRDLLKDADDACESYPFHSARWHACTAAYWALDFSIPVHPSAQSWRFMVGLDIAVTHAQKARPDADLAAIVRAKLKCPVAGIGLHSVLAS